MSKTNKAQMGQGIKALLANIEKKNTSAKATEISSRDLSTNYLEPNPFQPRYHFKEDDLEELIQSVRVHGIIQPIAVRKLSAKSYQIISGERRWRAAKALKLEKVPVHIITADDQAMLELALLENIQRADLNPIEIAISYQRLIDECALTHEELSERIGKKRSSITNYLRLLKLSPSVQDAVKNEIITMGHAKILAGIDQVERQTLILGEILKDELSVRATEHLLKTNKNQIDKKNSTKGQSTYPNSAIKEIIRDLSSYLGTPVTINHNEEGYGYIRIPFDSDDDLNDIIDSILE